MTPGFEYITTIADAHPSSEYAICPKCNQSIELKSTLNKCSKCKRIYSRKMLKSPIAPQLNDYQLRSLGKVK